MKSSIREGCHIILGIVVAMTIPIIPRHFVSVGQLIVDLACIAAGVVAAILINRLCEKVASRSRVDA